MKLLYMIPRHWSVALGHDLTMVALSFLISLFLRLGDDWSIIAPYLLQTLAIFIATCGVVFSLMRLYKGMWRYASTQDVIAIAKAVTLSILIFALVMFLYNRLAGVPRSVLFINWFVLIALLTGPRFLYRVMRDGALGLDVRSLTAYDKIPVLLVGLTDNTEHFLRESKHSPYRIVGIVADDKTVEGRKIRNVRVYTSISGLVHILEKLKRKSVLPQKVIITDDSLRGEVVRQIFSDAEAQGLTVARMPRLTEFKRGQEDGLEVRPIDMEDLLGRPQHALDRPAMQQMIAGKTVLVTGAGGTIGGELVRQIAGYDPKAILLLDSGEHNLYRIEQQLSEQAPELASRALLQDVCDLDELHAVFANYKPQIVFHAAALKHVPLAEANPLATMRTNIIGTRNVVDLSLKHQVEAMVLISTDKAVNPTSVMGASKRVAECYVQSLEKQAQKKGVKLVTVRFGNVLGSSGSVIPLFERQLREGGPLTVTDKEINRYFMTVREAVELVLQSAVLAIHDKKVHAAIYVLEMGEPVKIVALAEQVIRLAGYQPYEDIDITFIGMRPGEKLYEELFYAEENPQATSHPAIRLASPDEARIAQCIKQLKSLESLLRKHDVRQARPWLQKAVENYSQGG